MQAITKGNITLPTRSSSQKLIKIIIIIRSLLITLQNKINENLPTLLCLLSDNIRSNLNFQPHKQFHFSLATQTCESIVRLEY